MARRKVNSASRSEQSGPAREDDGGTRPNHRVAIVISLSLLVLLPNLSSISGAFLYDDFPLIVQNARVQSLSSIPEIWTSGYWPDRPGLTLYRPVSLTIWCILWVIGGGSPVPFHLLNLVMGTAVVLLLWRCLEDRGFGRWVAITAAAIFAVLPIHSEAVASIVGSSELLAAAFGISCLLALRRDRPVLGIVFFAVAVLSKESAAALAAVAWLDAPKGERFRPRFFVMGAIIAAVLVARVAVTEGEAFIPPIDNPMSLVRPWQRVITALWIQVLYLVKTFVPVHLSADYSYKEIPLVMGFGDDRAWAGVLLLVVALILIVRPSRYRFGALWYAICFAPAANVLFPIGTMMGERLAYLPSAGLAMMAAQLLVGRFDDLGGDVRQRLRAKPARAVPLVVVAVLVSAYAWRTWDRNQVWQDRDVFYRTLAEDSPGSAKVHYFMGCLLSFEGDDAGAVEAYDRAIAIFPAYPEALNNRGNSLVRLGRLEEAKESYRGAVRFDRGHKGAAESLMLLEMGLRPNPPRGKL